MTLFYIYAVQDHLYTLTARRILTFLKQKSQTKKKKSQHANTATAVILLLFLYKHKTTQTKLLEVLKRSPVKTDHLNCSYKNIKSTLCITEKYTAIHVSLTCQLLLQAPHFT